MKRYLAILLTLTMVLTLAACGGSSTAPAPSAAAPAAPAASAAPAAPAAPVADKVTGDFIMATGGTSGTYYAFGGVICQVLNKATGSNITANSTGASVENVRLLQSGEADLAIVQTDIQAYAVAGINNFTDTGKVTNVKAIASLYPEVVHVVTTDQSLNTVGDLKGKAISVGAAGSGTEINARQFLEAYKLTYDDVDVRYLSFAESATALQDGSIAAAFIVAGTPNAAIVELSVARPVKILSVGEAEQKALIEKYPFFAPHTVTKDIYNTPADASTLAIKAVLIAREELSENDVYLLTKALFEKQPDLAAAHAKGAVLSKDTALVGVVPGNVHPGAAKYYKEIGVKVA
ncbi:MAG: TAXI family TRAP transporter solute-binding subunit [Oscillospiraceae bacterium]